MFSKIRWRIGTAYLALIMIVITGLAYFLAQPTCAYAPACTRRYLLYATLILAICTPIIGHIIAERTARPVRQLTQVAQRITAGDVQARLLARTRDEVSDLIRAFNDMQAWLTDELHTVSKAYQQLATAVEYMADGVIITDSQSYVQLINPTAVRLLETSEAEALTRSFAEVVRHHQLIELWQQCQQSSEEQTAAVEIGRDIFLQTVITPFHASNAAGFLFIMQDLTTVRRLQTVRRDFISNVSHELRTPLASLRAVVETLQDGALAEPQLAQRFLGRAEQEIDTMTQMVEELLELSRIESGQVPLRLEETAVANLLHTAIERLKGQAKRNAITITLDLPPDLPPVLADPGRIHQVVANLLHNAIKFTPTNGTIHISAHADNGRFPPEVVIAIQDNGSGIAEEDIARIFERFFKSDRARTRGQSGTGLGLAISRHIVQAHNGRIWVKSKEKKGSTFTFTLPQP